jgi:hypothetical protein
VPQKVINIKNFFAYQNPLDHFHDKMFKKSESVCIEEKITKKTSLVNATASKASIRCYYDPLVRDIIESKTRASFKGFHWPFSQTVTIAAAQRF